MYQKGQRIEVALSDAAEHDKSFGRLADGIGVFVRDGKRGEKLAVGDTVEAEIVKVKKNYLEAEFTQLLAPSPSRIAPECSHFGNCGGCKWQHVSYDAQLRQKEKQVQDVLRHIGGFTNISLLPTLGATRIYGYRNKIEFSFSDKRFLLPDEIRQGTFAKPKDFAVGFHAPERYDKVIDIDRCHIATPTMNTALAVVKQFAVEKKLSAYSTETHQGLLRALIVRETLAGETMVNVITSWHDKSVMTDLSHELKNALGEKLLTVVNNITTRKSNVSFGEEEVVVSGDGVITETLGSYRFQISANSFFQTNTAQAERLYQTALRAARLSPDDVVYDLYCGTGSISIFISAHCKKVFGIELVESAVKDAEKNAARNGVQNCSFKLLDLKDVQKIWPELEAFGLPDVVITDPPRAGMHPNAVQTLLKLSPKRIIYVSCNAASLARDGKLMCESGMYQLEDVQPVDMFPHTNHIESIARFERR
ncbi:MAG: RNA methyltransferase [[Candidatus Thermochlorobacteriaceae] bacterium GBChlB]|nr:MAG: RNA methyltransferase [[Candidatus Thermochlorobacteriaceae] bacterium GBChlB]